MGMFDTIDNVPAKCPRCGDERPKSIQIKSGSQRLYTYQFGIDKIDIDWNYECYGSVIDREKLIIRGIATCNKCREESQTKMEELIQEANDKKEIKAPEGEEPRHLFECQINGEDAFRVILNRLDDAYGGDRNIEMFDVAIWLDKDYIPMAVDLIVDMNKI